MGFFFFFNRAKITLSLFGIHQCNIQIFLSRYNSFIRRLIYQTAKEKFGSDVLLETAKDSTLRVTKGISEEEKEKRQNAKWEEEKESIHREFGFSEIIQQIIHSVRYFLLSGRINK